MASPAVPGAVNVTNLTGLEVVAIATVGPTSAQTTTAAIAALAATDSSSNKITVLSTVGAGTITAAGIVGKIIQRTGTQTAGFTDTTDTPANLIAALPTGAPIGTSFQWTYENTTGFPAIITGASGVTVSGITSVATNSWARYLVTYSAANTFTVVGFEAGPILAQNATTQQIAAAGSNSQSAATAINPALGREVIVTTTSATSRGIALPVATTGLRYEVFNQGAAPVHVYPVSGGTAKIGTAATNASVSITNNKGGIFLAKDATHWALMLSA